MKHVWKLSALMMAGAATACGDGGGDNAGAAMTALEVMSLHQSEAGRVSFADVQSSGGDHVFSAVTVSLDDGAALRADSFSIDNLRLSGESLTADSVALREIVLSGDDDAAVTVDAVTLEDPSPALLRVLARAFSRSVDGDAVFADTTPQEVAFGAFALEGVAIETEAESPGGRLSVAQISAAGLGPELLDSFTIRDVIMETEGPDGLARANLGAFTLEGLDATLFQELFDVAETAADAVEEGGGAEENLVAAVLDSGLFTQVYAKRFDTVEVRDAAVNVAGVQLDVGRVFARLDEEDGRLVSESTGEGFVLSADPESGQGGAMLAGFLAGMGYDSLKLQFDSSVAADPSADRVTSNRYTISLDDGFGVDVDFDVAGYQAYVDRTAELQRAMQDSDAALLMDPMRLLSTYEPLIVHGFSMRFADDGFFDRAFAASAAQSGRTVEQAKEAASIGLLFLPAMAPTPGTLALAQDFAEAAASFLAEPGVFTLSVDPVEPARIGELLRAAQAPGGDPDLALEALNVSVSYAAPAGGADGEAAQ